MSSAGIRALQVILVLWSFLETLVSSESDQRALWTRDDTDGAIRACQLLQELFPQLVSFPGKLMRTLLAQRKMTDSTSGEEKYTNDTAHWAISSQQNSTCSIEPQSADDVSIIVSPYHIYYLLTRRRFINFFKIKVIGRSDIRTLFAVSQ